MLPQARIPIYWKVSRSLNSLADPSLSMLTLMIMVWEMHRIQQQQATVGNV